MANAVNRTEEELARLREWQRQQQANQSLAEQLKTHPPLTDTSSTGDPRVRGEGREYRRPRSLPPLPTGGVSYPIKILFRVQRGGNYEFYVGGDRKKPLKIAEFPVSNFQITLSTGTQSTGDAHLSNTGKTQGDWIATIVTYTGDGWAVHQYRGRGSRFSHQMVGISPCPLVCRGWGFCNGLSGLIASEQVGSKYWLDRVNGSDFQEINETQESFLPAPSTADSYGSPYLGFTRETIATFKADALELGILADSVKRGLFEVYGELTDVGHRYFYWIENLSDTRDMNPQMQFDFLYGFKARGAFATLNGVEQFQDMFVVQGTIPADVVAETGTYANVQAMLDNAIASSFADRESAKVIARHYAVSPSFLIGRAEVSDTQRLLNSFIVGPIPAYEITGAIEVRDNRTNTGPSQAPVFGLAGKTGGMWRRGLFQWHWNEHEFTEDGNLALDNKAAINIVEQGESIEVYEIGSPTPDPEKFTTTDKIPYIATKASMEPGEWELTAALKPEPEDEYDIKQNDYKVFPLRIESSNSENNALSYALLSESFYPLGRSW